MTIDSFEGHRARVELIKRLRGLVGTAIFVSSVAEKLYALTALR